MMSDDDLDLTRRGVFRRGLGGGLVAATWLTSPTVSAATNGGNERELVVDHVMFPTYLSDEFLDVAEANWRGRSIGRVFRQAPNPFFKGLYVQSKSFYVEHLSNTKDQPYWSNAVYLVVPTKYWDYYKNPALRTDYFLIPQFGCGYQLVSPDYPHLNERSAERAGVTDDEFVLLISSALEKELLRIGGVQWRLPRTGKVRVHEKLLHLHDMAVLDGRSKVIAPILQPNPILREYL